MVTTKSALSIHLSILFVLSSLLVPTSSQLNNAAMYSNLPLWELYLQPGSHNFSNGANFASARAGVLQETDPDTVSISGGGQFTEQQLRDAKAKKILAGAIYLSSFGGVDYLSFINNTPNPAELQQREYVNMVIGNFTDVITVKLCSINFYY
ncbi:hypothetical protein Pint_29410 [Pistacia integerrima]|uniref:Uncharacterized protein n=1 Tax=Pistacia integerrima TaxID=434235 RepID=A0ACC0X2N1_9ROSI|nr:hypothetical protein Pint_29410 [Pistacia integerrima]